MTIAFKGVLGCGRVKQLQGQLEESTIVNTISLFIQYKCKEGAGREGFSVAMKQWPIINVTLLYQMHKELGGILEA